MGFVKAKINTAAEYIKPPGFSGGLGYFPYCEYLNLIKLFSEPVFISVLRLSHARGLQALRAELRLKDFSSDYRFSHKAGRTPTPM